MQECAPDFLPEGDEAGGVAEGDCGRGVDVGVVRWAVDCLGGVEGVVVLGVYYELDSFEVGFCVCAD